MKIETTGTETTAVAIVVIGSMLFVTHTVRQIGELTHNLMDGVDRLKADRLTHIDKTRS